MTREDRIMLMHPAGKSGVNISGEKYWMMKGFIIDILSEECELTFNGLRSLVETRLNGKFHGSISWYYTMVKLDLEARGMIVRIGTGSLHEDQNSSRHKAGLIKR